MPARPRRLLAALAATLTATSVLLVGPGAPAPATAQEVGRASETIGATPSTSGIHHVATTQRGVWRYDQYRNPAYPCSTSGSSTFTIATRTDVSADAVRPLWVYLHGGGFGYFDSHGGPQPGTGLMVEETPLRQVGFLERGDSNSGGVLAEVRAATDATSGYRMLAVSMCNHDGYMGGVDRDPNHPFGLPVGGLAATKAAIAFTLRTVPTDDYLLHGTSSGSFGAWGVAWAMDEMGVPAAGVIGDSGIFNEAYEGAVVGEKGCGDPYAEGYTTFRRRVHPDLRGAANRPGALVADGRISSPVLDVYVPNDPIWCGDNPVSCPVGGVTVPMGATDCMHEEMTRAIAAQGPASRSATMKVCVDDPRLVGDCDRHVPSVITGAVSDPLPPRNFQAAIMRWARDRLSDDGVVAPSDRTPGASFAAAATRDFLGSDDLPRADALATALAAGQPKVALLRRLTTSEPWLARIVGDLYLDTLGRPGDAGGVAYWIGVLARGERTVAEVAARFYASPEYYAGLGGGTDASWVTDLYDAILRRAPEPGGVDYWVGQVARRGRSSVALRLFQSAESAGARVRDLYTDLLGRAPSASDVTYWSPQVVARGDLTLAVSLANSPEYQSRAEARYP